jgi:hypothetical protein
MDCFVATLLAMTLIGLNTTSHSRGASRPKFCWKPCSSEIRGRREDRMRAAPAVSRAMCIKECCTRAYRFSGEPPAFPAQWLYGLYDLVLVTGFLATIIGFSFRFRQLDASTGASDPNDFAVRSRRARQSQPSRPPLPAPTFVTMADAPLAGRDGGSCRVESTCPQRGIFSRQGLDQHLG